MKIGKAMTDYLQAEAGGMTEKLKARRPAKSGGPTNGDSPLPFITWYSSSPVLQTEAKGSATQETVPRMQQNSKEGEEHSYGKILAY
jgi:hypothetical protein